MNQAERSYTATFGPGPTDKEIAAVEAHDAKTKAENARRREGVVLLKKIADAIIDTVREAGITGCPGGALYMAMQQHGCTIEQYNIIMGTLVECKKLRKHGDLYFVN